jgi:hypothetical protein
MFAQAVPSSASCIVFDEIDCMTPFSGLQINMHTVTLLVRFAQFGDALARIRPADSPTLCYMLCATTLMLAAGS